jgi:hypothetical protein
VVAPDRRIPLHADAAEAAPRRSGALGLRAMIGNGFSWVAPEILNILGYTVRAN